MEGCIIAGKTVRGMLATSVAIVALTILLATLLWAGPGVPKINVQIPDSAMRPVQALQLWRVAILRAGGVTPPALEPRTGWDSSSTSLWVATAAL